MTSLDDIPSRWSGPACSPPTNSEQELSRLNKNDRTRSWSKDNATIPRRTCQECSNSIRPEEMKETKIMKLKLLLKIKSGTPPQRKSSCWGLATLALLQSPTHSNVMGLQAVGLPNVPVHDGEIFNSISFVFGWEIGFWSTPDRRIDSSLTFPNFVEILPNH
jgi:hypothetical protein